MSEQVKRYDAVHIRYEDNNIRYGEGCEVEVVTARDYDALHAEAEALRVALLGIASVNPAERGIEWAKSYASDGLKGAGSELYARWLDTFKEAEALRSQVSALQSDANSWQSGYHKGREDGAKAAGGWKAQHARDSAELRKLCAERDALAAELKRWGRSYQDVHEPALREAHAYIQDLRAELEAARGLMRDIFCTCNLREMPSEHAIRDISNQIEALLTATQAPEVQAEQGGRQETNQDVRALVEAAQQADDVLSAIVRNDQPIETLKREYGEEWSSAIDTVRASLATQIAARRQAQRQA